MMSLCLFDFIDLPALFGVYAGIIFIHGVPCLLWKICDSIGSFVLSRSYSGKLKFGSFFVAEQMVYGCRISRHLSNEDRSVNSWMEINEATKIIIEVRTPRGQRHAECPGPHSVVLLCPQDNGATQNMTWNARHRVRFLSRCEIPCFLFLYDHDFLRQTGQIGWEYPWVSFSN